MIYSAGELILNPLENIIPLIENWSELGQFAHPQSGGGRYWPGHQSDTNKAVGAEARMTGHTLNTKSGAQTPDVIYRVETNDGTFTNSIGEVKLHTSVTDHAGQTKINYDEEGNVSTPKNSPAAQLAVNMGLDAHIKKHLPRNHSFQNGTIMSPAHGILQNATAGAIAVAHVGQKLHGKNQIEMDVNPDAFRKHMKNIGKSEHYFTLDGVAAGIPYRKDHPHKNDERISGNFAKISFEEMSDDHIKQLSPVAILRAKHGGGSKKPDKMHYSAEMSVRFRNPLALHHLQPAHTTPESLRHGGGTNANGENNVRMFSGHQQRPDGSWHQAGVKDMHLALAHMAIHGRQHEREELFPDDRSMTDFVENHYDEKKIKLLLILKKRETSKRLR